MSDYEKQDRGDGAAYAAYFAGMEQSAQQKVALTTAHFPSAGVVADMGCGSGKTTFDLASLFAGLDLVGVDVNPVTVEWARQRYRRGNLRFVAGDIAEPLFAEGSLAAILDSSVLHHVTSFTGFSTARLEELLDHQVRALAPGGVLLVRDFVVPEGPPEVILELRSDDGDDSTALATASTAALFRRFAADFRSSQNRHGAVPYSSLPEARPGWARFRVALRAAAEFVLRKDYRGDWATELLEEYTYFTQHQFEEALRRRGLRVVVSAPLWNPWIVAHRFRGQIALVDGAEELSPPPTNYLVVGEKVGPGRGVALVEVGHREIDAPRFLALERWRRLDDGRLFELVRRPNPTIDLLPWFEEEGRLWVLAKHGFPRPITVAQTPSLDPSSTHVAGWVTEPLAAIVSGDQPPAALAAALLHQRAGLAAAALHELSPALRYFPSPGGLGEEAFAHLVRIDPWRGERAVANYSCFVESGSVRHLEATQLLRASHVGGLFDARLEINTYHLLRRQGQPLGPWIGAELSLAEAPFPIPARSTHELLAPPARRAFVPAGPGPLQFLELREGQFEERSADGALLARGAFEYVLPRRLAHTTVAVLPWARQGGRLFVGLETRDLPAAQIFEGSSAIVTVPAARLSREVASLGAVAAAARGLVDEEFGIAAQAIEPLGGAYRPSMGVTPELVFPFAAQAGGPGRGLTWVPLDELLRCVEQIRDAHLLVTAYRLAHAAAHRDPAR